MRSPYEVYQKLRTLDSGAADQLFNDVIVSKPPKEMHNASPYANDWQLIVTHKDKEEFDKNGTIGTQTTKDGVDVAIVTGKRNDKTLNKITLERWYVSVPDCNNHQGALVRLSLDGQFKSKYDFVFGAGSVGSIKAETICKMYVEWKAR